MNEYEVTSKNSHGYYYANRYETTQETDGSTTAHFFRGNDECVTVENLISVKESVTFYKKDYQRAKQFLSENSAEMVRCYKDPTVMNTTWSVNGELWHENESMLEAPEDGYILYRMSARVIV